MSRLQRQPLSLRPTNVLEGTNEKTSKARRRISVNQEQPQRPSIFRSSSKAEIAKFTLTEAEETDIDFKFKPCEVGDPSEPLDVCKYQHIIYKTFRKKEVERKEIQFNQMNISLFDRHVVVDSICRIHYKLGSTTNTFYRFIGIFDKFLNIVHVSREELMLYATASFLIATKMEDIYPAQSLDLMHLTNNSFTQEALFTAEIRVANTIKFSATFGTGLFFLTHFLRIEDEEDQDFHYFARFVLEICQTSDFFFGAPFSLMAAAAVHATRFVWRQSAWTKKLEGYTGYTVEDLKQPLEEIRFLVNSTERRESKFIFRKYSCDLYHGVALLGMY
jgi:hypothetical protein